MKRIPLLQIIGIPCAPSNGQEEEPSRMSARGSGKEAPLTGLFAVVVVIPVLVVVGGSGAR